MRYPYPSVNKNVRHRQGHHFFLLRKGEGNNVHLQQFFESACNIFYIICTLQDVVCKLYNNTSMFVPRFLQLYTIGIGTIPNLLDHILCSSNYNKLYSQKTINILIKFIFCDIYVFL